MPLLHGFVPPCLPTKALEPPSGEAWLHEIKHDGFRVIARKDGNRVRLYSRPGNDLTHRFPLADPDARKEAAINWRRNSSMMSMRRGRSRARLRWSGWQRNRPRGTAR